jgi:NTP pyrophosphatase (non-canonical NTP hydrolase)
MKFDDFQQKAMTFRMMQKNDDIRLAVLVLGLTGESGEVAEKIKKIFRDKGGRVSENEKHELTKELGDVLWYLAAIADFLGVKLSSVAELHIKKGIDRKNRGVQHGDGDNR